jgi:KUP system potassium uptake protein
VAFSAGVKVPKLQEARQLTLPINAPDPTTTRAGLTAMSLAALGVVFGDIGTSPLYTLKTVLDTTGPHPSAQAALGSLSLIVWTLIVITSVKYVTLAMRVDNDGEGGILALMSLLGIRRAQRPMIVAVGLFGAALIYGDGAITPAISVLSALEGLDIATPALHPYILPASVAILIALFTVQQAGTARIGVAFGPLMAVWFIVMALLGIGGIARHPAVLLAINPIYGLSFLASSGMTGFLVLGGVFLCVTGAEALYADMGHFGPRAIRLAWSALVLPALLLNYAGQAALVIAGAPTEGNTFYRLAPDWLLIPLVLLATVATIIASQAIITGAFSMTRQAIQLGWLPRLPITQTSAEGYGQIYVGPVNWMLMAVTIGLTVGFGKSDNLAAAYGIAVSMTMLMTTVLLFIAMREVWQWGLLRAGAVAGALAVVDAAFVSANMLKVADGGYVPVLLAVVVYGVMVVWHMGAAAVATRMRDAVVPIGEFLAQIAARGVARVPGTAVFLTRTVRDAPPVMIWHVRHNRALHERVFILNVATQMVPYVPPMQRLSVEQIGPNTWRGAARFGFMERPDIPALLAAAHKEGCGIDPADLTYFVGHETVVWREDGRGLPHWVEALYAFMQRNSLHVTDYFRLPAETVVELGREVAI